MKIFISYDPADISFVHAFEPALVTYGFETWYDLKPDGGLRGGEDRERRVQSELDSSTVVLVVLSPNSIRAESSVENEYQYAQRKDKRVIPLLYYACTVPLSLTNLHPIDFSRSLYISAFAQLMQALKVGEKTPVAAATELSPAVPPTKAPVWSDYPVLEHDVSLYKKRFAERLERDAERQMNGLDTENYIQNYIPLYVSEFWGNTIADNSSENQSDFMELLHRSRYESILLFGEPGSGKSASMRRFAWELARNDPLAVPIFVSLQECRNENIGFSIISELKRYGTFSFLQDAQDLKRLAQESRNYLKFYLLLDGLNEILPSLRENILKSLETFRRDSLLYLTLITCRAQADGKLVQALENIDLKLKLRGLSKTQLDDYLPEHAGSQTADSIRIRKLAENPSLLVLIKRLGAHPQVMNQSTVFTGFLRHELEQDKEKGIGLDVADEHKVKSLAFLGFALNLRYQVSIKRNEALTLLSKEFKLQKPHAMLDVLLQHGFLVQERDLQTAQHTARIHFAPNLMMQEYFAALQLQSILLQESAARSGAIHSREIIRQKLVTLALGPSRIAHLARDPWWTETFILLYGLLNDPTQNPDKTLPKWLIDPGQNPNENIPPKWLIAKLVYDWQAPWLAWWCYDQKLGIKDEKLEEMIRDKIAGLISHKDPALRYKAVETLFHSTPRNHFLPPRTMELLFKAAGDEEPKVLNRALEALLDLDEYRSEFINAADERVSQGDESTRGGARRFLLTLCKKPDTDLLSNMIHIPLGPFTAGSIGDLEATIDEPTRHRIVLPEYWLAEYPIRNRDYLIFVEQTGHPAPSNWHDDRYPANKEDHPVTCVNWFDACAYCEWLTRVTGYPFRLPTEAEWEKGARGTDGRSYPWGDDKPENNHCNYRSTNLADTTPVGAHPLDKSPYGCHDMAGNVNEWCLYDPRKFPSRQVPKRPLRGGSFMDEARALRCVWRHEESPEKREPHVGFRVVISLHKPVKFVKTAGIYELHW